MMTSSNRIATALTAVVLSLGLASASQAIINIVPAGYDVFVTIDPTLFDIPGQGLVPFEGNPGALGFDNICGPQDMGNADTVVRRLAEATPASPDIPIEIVELHLTSVAPIDIGNGPETLFIQLNTDQGGGTMTFLGLPGSSGPVQSQLNFSFDLSGSTTGFIATEIISLVNDNIWTELGVPNAVIKQCPGPWIFPPPPGWPEEHIADNQQKHTVKAATNAVIPVLGTTGLIVLGVGYGAAILIAVRRRRSRSA